MATKVAQPLDYARKAVAFGRHAVKVTLDWLRAARTWIKASPPYQWLDRHVIDAPPIKATTFIGYVTALTLTLLALFVTGIWVVTSNVRQAAAQQSQRVITENARLKADNTDLIKHYMAEDVLLKASLAECRAMLAVPRAPTTVIPKNKRGALSSPRKPLAEAYRGPALR